MTNKEKAEKILDRYLTGKANTKERKLVDKWYYSFKSTISRDEQSRKQLEEELFKAIVSQIDHNETPAFKLLPYLKYAAILLLVSAAGIASWNWKNNGKPAAAYMIISTAKDQHKKIMLQDGSVILLGPLSQVKYPKRFKSDKRIVELLEGRAFFNIHHDKQRPFSVLLPNQLFTHVLGTSFTINAYKRSERIDVAVSSGKVAVGNDAKLLGVLTKGEQLLYNKTTRKSTVSLLVQPVRSLIFDNSPMSEVLATLQSAYGIKINVQHGLKLEHLKFTGTFSTSQQPGKILWLLSRIHHFNIDASADDKTFKIFMN